MDPELFTYLDGRFTEIDGRFTEIDGRFTEIDGRFTEIDGRFTEIDGRFTEIDRRFTESERRQSQELHRALAAQSAELRKEMALQSEVDRRFREAHVLIEGLQTKIETVAEGVSANYEAIQRLSAKMDRQFEKLISMFRLSYGEGARGAADPA